MKVSKILPLALVISASAFAGSDVETRLHELEKKVETITTVTPEGLLGVRPAPARAEPNGKGWFISVDALYWQSKIGATEYAVSNDNFEESQIHFNGTTRAPTFGWDFGFKVGLGYDFFYDGWDMYAEYTYFQNTASDRYGVAAPAGIVPIPSSLLNITAPDIAGLVQGNIAEFCSNAVSDLKLAFNNVILSLGKDFYLSKKLSMRPNVGLQAAWITISQNSRYFGGAELFTVPTGIPDVTRSFNGLGSETVYYYKQTKLASLGPTLGFDSQWYLGNHFSVYGNARGSLLFGYFKDTDQSSYSGTENSTLVRNSFHRVVPTTDMMLGICYDKYIMDDTQHIYFGLGYEIQYFWDVFARREVIGGVGMYGVDFKVRWDF